MAHQSSHLVNYERIAARYHEGRSLPDDVLRRWREAVTPHLPSEPITVADLGAGTGIFAEAWRHWTDARVVAIEPSGAMARSARMASQIAFVQGVAEAIPIRSATVDLVWVSTALHHFWDMDLALDECRRVLRPGGRILVRTYAPDRSELTWANVFPGRSKWQKRFPTSKELEVRFAARGFLLTAISEVLERSEPFAESASWVSRMRNADSVLTALRDEEVEQGLARLHATPERIGRTELTLCVFRVGR